MNYLTRRNAIKLGLQSATALYGIGCMPRDFAYAAGGSAPQNGRTLVLLIKNGGQDMVRSMPFLGNIADELSTVRPNLHITPGNALHILNNDIGLHLNYDPLTPIAEAGKLKVVLACGFEKHSGSHQEAISHMSHGARHLVGSAATNGWIAKAKDHLRLDNFSVIGFGTGNIMDLRAITGPGLALGNDLGFFKLSNLSKEHGGDYDNAQFAQEVLIESLALISEPNESVIGQVKQSHQTVTQSIQVVADIETQPLITMFPKSTLGKNFSNAAKFLKWNAVKTPTKNSLLVITVGGYDTHENEASQLDNLIASEASCLRAFYDEMALAGLNKKVTVVSISEFSRTLKENSGRGTDHAKATNIMVIGGDINGGGNNSVYGPLATSSDISRNYIPTTVHYYDVVKELLLWWGAQMSDIEVIVPEKPPVNNTIGLFS
jgi:uncharacterized protein (DUF1501 family)